MTRVELRTSAVGPFRPWSLGCQDGSGRTLRASDCQKQKVLGSEVVWRGASRPQDRRRRTLKPSIVRSRRFLDHKLVGEKLLGHTIHYMLHTPVQQRQKVLGSQDGNSKNINIRKADAGPQV